MAPPKPYKSRILGGSSKTAGVRADVRVADKSTDRFASGIMSKYGFTRGNYLGRLSLVFKQQRELVRQIMRGAKSSDVMTAQWLIRLQQLQQAMPATPRERMAVSETTRLVERTVVVKETARTGNGQPVEQSALAPESKPNGTSEERSDTPRSGRSGRSRVEQSDRSERGDKQAKTTKKRSPRKSTEQDGTNPSSPDGKPKRKRKASREAVNQDMKADDPATETAPPSKAGGPRGKGVVIIRAKPYGVAGFTHLEAIGPKRVLGMQPGPGQKSGIMQLAGRHGADDHPGSSRARNEQPVRLSFKNVFLQPFEMIYRSTRSRTYAESVIDNYTRAIAPTIRSPLIRNESVRLRGTPRLDRNSVQAKQANREHNEGYSAETVRPMDRDSGYPAVESLFPSNRAADSIRLPYKLPASAKIGGLPPERKHASPRPFPLSGDIPAVAAIDGQGPNLSVHRLSRKPIGGGSISLALGRGFSPALGNRHAIRRPLQGNGLSIPEARAIRRAVVFARQKSADPYIMLDRFAFRRSAQHKYQGEKSSVREPSVTRKSDRSNGLAPPSARLEAPEQEIGAGPAKRGGRASDLLYRASAVGKVKPFGGKLYLPMLRHDWKGNTDVHRRLMQPSPSSDDANGLSPVFSQGVLSNSARSSIRGVLNRRSDTAFWSARPASSLRSWLGTSSAMAFDGLSTNISPDNRFIAAKLQRAGHTNAFLRPYGNQSSAAIIIRKQRIEEEEDDKPFRDVHRFGNVRERGAASIPGSVPDGRGLIGGTIIPSAVPDDSEIADTAGKFDIARRSAADLDRAPFEETIVARARRIVPAIEKEASIVPSGRALRRELGIRRNLLDPTAMPGRDWARQKLLFSRDSLVHRERSASLRFSGAKLPTDGSRRSRYDRVSADGVEDGTIRASRRQTKQNERGIRSVVYRSPVPGPTPSRIDFSTGQFTAIRQLPYGIGASESARPTYRQLQRKMSATAYPAIKRSSRHSEPGHRFDRLAGTQSEDAVYSPRASAAPSLMSRLVLRRSSAGHAESDGGIPYGTRSPVSGKPYTEDPFHKQATSRLGQESGIGARSGPYEEDKKAFMSGIMRRPAMTSVSGGLSTDHADKTVDFPAAHRPIRLKRTAAPGTPFGHIRDTLSGEAFGMPFPVRIQASRSRYVNRPGSSPEPTSVFRTFVQRDDRGRPAQAHLLRLPSKSGILPTVMPVGSISRPQTDRMRLNYGNYGGTYGLADIRNTLRKYSFDADMGMGSARAFSHASPSRLAAGRSSPAEAAFGKPIVRLNPAKPQTIRTIEDRFGPKRIADKTSARTGSGPSYPATIGQMFKRLLPARQDPDAGPFALERGVRSGQSGTIRRRPLYGSDEAVDTRTYGGLQAVRQNGVIHRRIEYGAGIASAFGRNANLFRTAAAAPGEMDWGLSGFPSKTTEASLRQPALLSSAQEGRRISARASLSLMPRRYAGNEKDETVSAWPELPAGSIRRQASELNVMSNRMPTSVRIPATDNPSAEFAMNSSGARGLLSHSRIEASSRRDGPEDLVNRLWTYGNSGSGTAAERMPPVRRRVVPTVGVSALSAGKDGMTPSVVGAASHRRPASEARQDNERWSRPGSGIERVLYRYRNRFTDRTDRIHTTVPFDSAIAGERASAARNSGGIGRMAQRERHETAMAAPVMSARSAGMAGEKLVFPYRYREAAADGMERIRRRWSVSDSNDRTTVVRNVNRFTSSPALNRVAAPILSIHTLGRAAGENGMGSAYAHRAAGRLNGTANHTMHTIRDSYRARYDYYFAKTGAARQESAEKRLSDRIRPSAATELRLLRTATNPGAPAGGTLRTGKSGETSPAWPERRGIPQQRQMAVSTAPDNVLRMKQSDARHTDPYPMFQLEHKLKAIVPGALGSDPADLDYRRQMKPAAPTETAPAAESAPPQVDMAELQEMVKRLPQFDIKKIVDRVYREIERKIRFDRQTRGL